MEASRESDEGNYKYIVLDTSGRGSDDSDRAVGVLLGHLKAQGVERLTIDAEALGKLVTKADKGRDVDFDDILSIGSLAVLGIYDDFDNIYGLIDKCCGLWRCSARTLGRHRWASQFQDTSLLLLNNVLENEENYVAIAGSRFLVYEAPPNKFEARASGFASGASKTGLSAVALDKLLKSLSYLSLREETSTSLTNLPLDGEYSKLVALDYSLLGSTDDEKLRGKVTEALKRIIAKSPNLKCLWLGGLACPVEGLDTFLPSKKGRRLLHLGLSWSVGADDPDDEVEVRDWPKVSTLAKGEWSVGSLRVRGFAPVSDASELDSVEGSLCKLLDLLLDRKAGSGGNSLGDDPRYTMEALGKHVAISGVVPLYLPRGGLPTEGKRTSSSLGQRIKGVANLAAKRRKEVDEMYKDRENPKDPVYNPLLNQASTFGPTPVAKIPTPPPPPPENPPAGVYRGSDTPLTSPPTTKPSGKFNPLLASIKAGKKLKKATDRKVNEKPKEPMTMREQMAQKLKERLAGGNSGSGKPKKRNQKPEPQRKETELEKAMRLRKGKVPQQK
jgi:hypothetical protein